jgi:hypothetical protein
MGIVLTTSLISSYLKFLCIETFSHSAVRANVPRLDNYYFSKFGIMTYISCNILVAFFEIPFQAH